MDSSRRGPRSSSPEHDLIGTAIREAREFVAVQPSVQHGPTVHWLDQGSSRLARRASIVQLQQMWSEAQAEAVRRGAAAVNRIDEEASRLFRLAIAMAIVAKDEARRR